LDTKKQYRVTEIELLAILEALKVFKGMLCGQQIVVYTDHKNLMQHVLGLTSNRVYPWRLIIEEYSTEIIYIKGKLNTVADAILQLEFLPKAYPKNSEQKKLDDTHKTLVCGGRHTHYKKQ
jgi:putative transposase